MPDPIATLFLRIVKEMSDGRILLKPSDPIAELFSRGFQPLDFEQALYSLEATTGRKIKQKFYEGAIEDYLAQPIGSFLNQWLGKAESRDPLFIAKVMRKFRQSAEWKQEEATEPGKN